MSGGGFTLPGEGEMFVYPARWRRFVWSSGCPCHNIGLGLPLWGGLVAGEEGNEGPARLVGMSMVRLGIPCHGVVWWCWWVSRRPGRSCQDFSFRMAYVQRQARPSLYRGAAECLAGASQWCSSLLLFLLAAQVLGLAATEMALLTMDPPWSTIFRGESVTLRCRGSHPHRQQPTTWYHNDKILARTDTDTYRITNARQKQTGRYKCQSPGSVSSNPITLIVSYDWLILQVPPHVVFEGEPLCMQCRGWDPGSMTSVRYFRDGADITTLYASDKQLCIPQAKTHQSGRYRCTGQMNSFLSVIKRESQELHVFIKELFSSPVLSVASSAETLEGSPLNLSCVTHLSPHSPHTILWYLFYRNSTVLQGPETSSKYQVPTVGLADTGSYFCEVQADNSSIRKQSAQVPIAVRRVPVSGVSLDVQPHEGQLMEGQRLVLSCSVAAGTGSISFSWHREGSAEVLGKGTRYEILSAQQNDDGQYYCMASNGDVPAQSPRLQVTVVGVSSLFYCHIRAPLLLAALGSLLSGLVAVHVLTAGSKDPTGVKQ
ncbi:Fc receptor-like protein 4 isoform X1 [Anser cygnoides]|uniref:Fc receptor-like protein 4 isoform X1 n=1 Tax=Anser cygnoides TaxID=8845 RepID=UPI0034D3467C